MNDEGIDKAKNEGIRAYVQSESVFMLRVIVLTAGERSSMKLADLAPLEEQARAWATAGPSESEIGNCKREAYEILRARFARVQKPADLALRLVRPMPADYDDSEIALGKQRIAQMERMEQAEKQRIHEVHTECTPDGPDTQEPADAWQEF
jgi:hypothetical protein